MEIEVETVVCPYCKQTVMIWFVRINNRCPACDIEMEVED